MRSSHNIITSEKRRSRRHKRRSARHKIKRRFTVTMRLRHKNILAMLLLVALAAGANAAGTKSGFVKTPDGVKIHYLEAGTTRTVGTFQVGGSPPPGALTNGKVSISNLHQQPAILFVPGWTMPAWIWQKQIDYFSKHYRVVAMDPRSQGESTITSEGLYPAARARDIKAVVDHLHLAPVVLVGWSMAVTELAAYIDQFGTRDLAGLVFVDDNFGGLAPGEGQADLLFVAQILASREKNTEAFVHNLCFKKPQPADYLNRVVAACMHTPTSDAVALLVGKYAADYRSAAAKMDKPALFCYADSPYMPAAAQQQIQQSVKGSRLEVFHGDGHALFVDDADHFNSVLDNFLNGLGD
jgi:non-heme chloroperoxidase